VPGKNILIRTATELDVHYAETIVEETANSAKATGKGIAKRSPEYIAGKMKEGKSVIAFTKDGQWIGFSTSKPCALKIF